MSRSLLRFRYRHGVSERRLLTHREREDLAASLPDWTICDDTLVRTVTAPDFRSAIAWVAAVADASEELDHHPDIDIRYRTVTFRLRTHDPAGLTTWDVSLAHRIDAILSKGQSRAAAEQARHDLGTGPMP